MPRAEVDIQRDRSVFVFALLATSGHATSYDDRIARLSDALNVLGVAFWCRGGEGESPVRKLLIRPVSSWRQNHLFGSSLVQNCPGIVVLATERMEVKRMLTSGPS